ncbi:hypothetical protein Tco_1413421 [Tanacetum coccineum]
MPLFPSPEPKISCFDDLDFFKDFENEFPTIVYNDALHSKSDRLTEHTLSPQHIDEFDLKDETSLSEYDEVEQNVLYFNDLFSFNIIFPDDLKSGKDNDDNKIDIIQSSGVNIVVWNYLVKGMLLNLIKNLYVPFGIPFDPKRYYKDGAYTRMLRRPRYVFFTLFKLGKLVSKNGYDVLDMALPPRDQRHQYLRFEGLQYTDADIADFEMRLGKIYRREVNRVQVFNFGGLIELMDERLRGRMLMKHKDAQGQSVESGRQISNKGDLSAYWREIYSEGDFLGTPPSYTLIRDPMLRLCYRLITCSIVGRSQALEKVFEGLTVIVRDLLVIDMAELVRLHICMELDDTWDWVAPGPKRQQVVVAGAPDATEDAPVAEESAPAVPAPVQAPHPPPPVARPSRTMAQRLVRVEEDVHEIRGVLGEQREILDSMACDFS